MVYTIYIFCGENGDWQVNQTMICGQQSTGVGEITFYNFVYGFNVVTISFDQITNVNCVESA